MCWLIQELNLDTLLYTDGAPAVPHGTMPQDTIPMRIGLFPSRTMRGPPESPCKCITFQCFNTESHIKHFIFITMI